MFLRAVARHFKGGGGVCVSYRMNSYDGGGVTPMSDCHIGHYSNNSKCEDKLPHRTVAATIVADPLY